MPPAQEDYEMEDEQDFEGPDAILEGDQAEEDQAVETISQIMNSNTPRGRSVQVILRSLFDTGEDDSGRISGIGLAELSQLLRGASATYSTPSTLQNQRAAVEVVEDDDDDDDDYVDEDEDEGNVEDYYGRMYQRTPHQWFPTHTTPQEAGTRLINGGEFGRVGIRLHSTEPGNVARALRYRGSKPYSQLYQQDVSNDLIPNTNGTVVASEEAKIYSGQFSKDSSFYYTCNQAFQLKVYDTTASLSVKPTRFGGSGLISHEDSSMKILKSIRGATGRWTITDSHLSPDNEKMIYSSIIPIKFADQRRRNTLWGEDEESFGIWSCRFSADGNEVVAGGSSGKIFVYDLLSERRTVKIAAHEDDVNSCCWADTASGNILISASDDSFVKVWDRRSLGTSQKPSGVLIGHTEGITSVAPKGDGRYIISNGKDQAMRLWDLRKMHSSGDFDTFKDKFYGLRHYDYRYGHYPKPKRAAHPKDCSVMTYRGHQVLQTLIRCQFSPIETTGGQYLYSGSADGKIHIWSIDGRVVQVLDRSKVLPISMDPSGPEPEALHGSIARVCVRDVSWHSQEPVLMSVGWDDGRGGSSVARHEWKGLSKLAGSVEDWVAKHKSERSECARKRSRGQVPGAFEPASSTDED